MWITQKYTWIRGILKSVEALKMIGNCYIMCHSINKVLSCIEKPSINYVLYYLSFQSLKHFDLLNLLLHLYIWDNENHIETKFSRFKRSKVKWNRNAVNYSWKVWFCHEEQQVNVTVDKRNKSMIFGCVFI